MGADELSEVVTFTLSHELLANAERVAAERGITVEDLAREALEQYLAS